MTNILTDDIKANFGRTATFVWLGGSSLLMMVDGGFEHFGGAWQAAVFVFGGMFVAAIVVGALSWWIHKRLVSHLMKFVNFDDPATIKRAERYRGLGNQICFVLSCAFLLIAFYSFG